MNDEDDLLDPAIRHWLLSEATPRVGAAAFAANVDGGTESALRAGNTAAALVEQIRHAPRSRSNPSLLGQASQSMHMISEGGIASAMP